MIDAHGMAGHKMAYVGLAVPRRWGDVGQRDQLDLRFKQEHSFASI